MNQQKIRQKGGALCSNKDPSAVGGPRRDHKAWFLVVGGLTTRLQTDLDFGCFVEWFSRSLAVFVGD